MTHMSKVEVDHCKERSDAATQDLRACYHQPQSSGYNVDEALQVILALSGMGRKLIYGEQQKQSAELTDHLKCNYLCGYQLAWSLRPSEHRDNLLVNDPRR